VLALSLALTKQLGKFSLRTPDIYSIAGGQYLPGLELNGGYYKAFLQMIIIIFIRSVRAERNQKGRDEWTNC
tara:strand:+ start:330 stop:545 length:216 start_codon:yes stop_codon:yes gene_type:complete